MQYNYFVILCSETICMLIGSYRKPKGCRKLKHEVTTFVERWGKKKEIPQN